MDGKQSNGQPAGADRVDPDPGERREERCALVERLASDAAWQRAAPRGERLSPRVRAALEAVPRHRFVPRGEQERAYEDVPLPIGHGQTISQPFIVALMTELLALSPHDRVLELGTGCGYQTAVLAELSRHVASVELLAELAEGARERLSALGYRNVDVRCGDGALGWPERAPFDAVLVAAAAAQIPAALIEQLAPGGRLVAPVGGRGRQMLVRLERDRAGVVQRRDVLPVAFVPLRGPRSPSEH